MLTFVSLNLSVSMTNSSHELNRRVVDRLKAIDEFREIH
jgi:hypothetical protein